MKKRFVFDSILGRLSHRHGRIVLLSGARQTGKSTLCSKLPGTFEYISFDDPVLRQEYLKLTADDWLRQFPYAILDEVQKVPQIFDTVKAVNDKDKDTRYVLTGSAQIPLLKNVKETLAGRVTSYRLYPLTLPESRTKSWDDEVIPSLFQTWLKSFDNDLLKKRPLLDPNISEMKIAFQNYLEFGAMPELTHDDLTTADKRLWLEEYSKAYLQRDLRDIAQLAELESFIKVQQYLANTIGQLLNYSSVSRLAGVSSVTAKKFVQYLEISCQTITLPPWFKNQNKRLAKSPKVHFLDSGIHRAILKKRDKPNGNEYESAVIAEIIKQVSNLGLPVEFYHLRTLDDREIDLVVELEHGYLLFEIKKSEIIDRQDARHLLNVEDIFDKPILASFVLSEDLDAKILAQNIYGLPACWFLG